MKKIFLCVMEWFIGLRAQKPKPNSKVEIISDNDIHIEFKESDDILQVEGEVESKFKVIAYGTLTNGKVVSVNIAEKESEPESNDSVFDTESLEPTDPTKCIFVDETSAPNPIDTENNDTPSGCIVDEEKIKNPEAVESTTKGRILSEKQLWMIAFLENDRQLEFSSYHISRQWGIHINAKKNLNSSYCRRSLATLYKRGLISKSERGLYKANEKN